jgi:hypothetical protein
MHKREVIYMKSRNPRKPTQKSVNPGKKPHKSKTTTNPRQPTGGREGKATS